MRAVLFEVQEWERPIFEPLADRFDLELRPEGLDSGSLEIARDAHIVSAFVSSPVTSGMIAEMPQLRLISTRSTGYDHVDLAACRERGITVCNVPEYGSATVAEHGFLLLLALTRHLEEAVRRTRSGNYDYEGILGFDLHGKVYGSVGTGGIGAHACRIAKGFGMEVLACDIEPDESLGVRYVGLEELLQRSDVVSLHVPLTSATENMISRAQLAQMKRTAVLINTARGGVVDSAALLEALDEGVIAGAGLDVLPNEPGLRAGSPGLDAERALMRHPKAVVTPHSAFRTIEALSRIAEMTRDNLIAFAEGRPINTV